MPETTAIVVITACMTQDGLPDFALTEVEATPEEIENGAHFYLAEQELGAKGYEEPYVHFGPGEGPALLMPAIREHLRTVISNSSISPVKEAVSWA